MAGGSRVLSDLWMVEVVLASGVLLVWARRMTMSLVSVLVAVLVVVSAPSPRVLVHGAATASGGLVHGITEIETRPSII